MDKPLYLTAREVYKVDEDSKDRIVYESMLAAICEWQLLPGSKLPEDGLADYFGVSRTVIRKTLHRLTLDRVVDILPNRGAFVKKISLEEAKHLFQIRRFLELEVIDSIVELAQPTHIEHLINHLVSPLIEAQKTSNTSKILILNIDFHLYLTTILNNSVITSLLAVFSTRILLALALYGRTFPTLTSVDFQSNLIECLRQKDKRLAKELLEKQFDLYDSMLKKKADTSETDFERVFSKLLSLNNK